MRCLYRTRPYELVPGSANALYEKLNAEVLKQIYSNSPSGFNNLIEKIVREFDVLPLKTDVRKPRIGLVGEILVKFNPTANNNIVQVVEDEGAEAVVPDYFDFLLYCVTDAHYRQKLLHTSKLSKWVSDGLVVYLNSYRKRLIQALNRSQRFTAPIDIHKMAGLVDDIVQLGHMAGEGWLLTAEMIELLNTGVNSIACLQPFACLPNHVTGKGMIKELRKRFPLSNICAIDYDPGASEVNQLNRLKLLLANATKSPNPDEPKISHHK